MMGFDDVGAVSVLHKRIDMSPREITDMMNDIRSFSNLTGH